MIATAVVEQLQEEKREEIAALRAETYSEVKVTCIDLAFHDTTCRSSLD